MDERPLLAYQGTSMLTRGRSVSTLCLKNVVQSELLRLLKRGNQTQANDNLVAAEMENIDAEYAALCGATELAVA